MMIINHYELVFLKKSFVFWSRDESFKYLADLKPNEAVWTRFIKFRANLNLFIEILDSTCFDQYEHVYFKLWANCLSSYINCLISFIMNRSAKKNI